MAKYRLGKYNRKSAHESLNNQIKTMRDQLQKAEETFGKAHQVIESIPLFAWEFGAWIAQSGTIYITLPWDWSKVIEFEKLMTEAGWKKTHEHNDADMRKAHQFWYPPIDDLNIMIYLTISPERPGSKCVLVPLKTETKEVVIAYDHVCPDEHPELFAKQEDGSLKYIGDNVFPAKQEVA